MKRFLLSLTSCAFTLINYAQSPGGINTNITVWLKANQGLTVNGTNQVTNLEEFSSATITGDFSCQGTTINKPTHTPPTVNPNGINFNPYLVFNQGTGTNSLSATNATAGLDLFSAEEATVFQIFNLKQSTNTGVWLKWQWSSNPYSGPRYGNEVNNPGSLGRVRYDFRNPNLVSTANVLNQHSLVTQLTQPSLKTIRFSGANDITAAASGTFAPGTTTGKLTIGAEPYGDDYPTAIDIAELIIYKRALTPAEINKVESYLAIKYGFTLSQNLVTNHYVLSNNAIVWDATANNGYNNNITGIARDDGSALSQVQSKSINTSSIVTILKNQYSGGNFPATNNLNTHTFIANHSAIIFGDDNASLNFNKCILDGKAVAIERIWKIVTTGNDGVATIAIDKSAIGSDVQYLIISDNTNFNQNTSFVEMQDNGSQMYAEFNFSGVQYFTFGSKQLELNAVADTICGGGAGNIITNPTGGILPYSFEWQTSPIQTTNSLMGMGIGSYDVIVKHANGLCQYRETYAITGSEEKMQVIKYDTFSSICTAPLGKFEIQVSSGSYPYIFSLDNTNWQQDGLFENLVPNSYTVYVRDNNNCAFDTTFTIVGVEKELECEHEIRDAYCDANGNMGYAKIKILNGMQPYKYEWNGNAPESKNEKFDIAKGSHKVIFTDKYGCKGDITFEIEEVPCCSYIVPNAFSPNNDGLNDVFVGYYTAPIPQFHMTIYNRWGQTVFVSGNADKGWDGNDYKSGLPSDNGTYYYYIKYTCPYKNEPYTMKGEVILLR